MERSFAKATWGLLFVALVTSGFLFYSDLQSDSSFCVTGDHGSCDLVQGSRYGSVFGLKVSYVGFFAIVLLTLFFYLSGKKWKYQQNSRELYLLGAVLGGFGALYFLSIQFFVLKAICSTCLVIDFSLVLIFVLSLVDWKKSKGKW